MQTSAKKLIDLETRFWQSMVNQDADTAMKLLDEPALMVSTHGSMKFDRAGYRKMAEQGSQVVTSFEFSDMDVTFPNESTAILTYHVKQGITPRGKKGSDVQEMNDTSTWVRKGEDWHCVMHTETPATAAKS